MGRPLQINEVYFMYMFSCDHVTLSSHLYKNDLTVQSAYVILKARPELQFQIWWQEFVKTAKLMRFEGQYRLQRVEVTLKHELKCLKIQLCAVLWAKPSKWTKLSYERTLSQVFNMWLLRSGLGLAMTATQSCVVVWSNRTIWI